MASDDRKVYREALAKARASFDTADEQLVELEKKKARLEEETANLRKTITALAVLCSEDSGLDKLGITDSILEVMLDSPFSWTTGEVVNQLDSMGFDLKSQKNAQASAHAVLTRLAQQGKITRIKDPKKNAEGHPWEWRGPAYDAEEDFKSGYCNKPA
jgi:hypothetical protein